MFSAVSVPVNTGDALFDLLFTATAMASNSAPTSEPLITLAGLPLTRASLAAKLVSLV